MLLSAGPHVHRHLASQAVHAPRSERSRCRACRLAHLGPQTSQLNKRGLSQHLTSTERTPFGVSATLRNALAGQAAMGTAGYSHPGRRTATRRWVKAQKDKYLSRKSSHPQIAQTANNGDRDLDAGASASAAVVFSHHIQERPAFAALHDAAGMGLDTISRLLLDAGADLNAGVEMDSRMTPLNVAAEDSRHRLVVLFLSRGATTDGCAEDLQEFSPGYLSRIARAGSFANYQKQQRAKLMAMLAPKFSHLLPPKLTSHVITFWAILGGNSCRRVILCDSKALGACSLCSFVVVLGLVGGARGGDTALRPSHRRRADSTS